MFVHPTAEVDNSVMVGRGTKIWHHAQIRPNVRIGQECILGKDVYVDEDVVIGDRVKIQNRASIYRRCLIEDGVFIGPHVCFANDQLPRAINPDGTLKSSEDWNAGSTIVRTGASIGAGAVILPGKTIGAFALVGAGSVVTRDVPDQALVVGNPARVIGKVCACGTRIDSEENQCLKCRSANRPVFAQHPDDVATSEAEGMKDSPHLTVAVVGLGKVGLPLAVQYASHGAKVIGCDINQAVVDSVNSGVTENAEESYLVERLREAFSKGKIRATTETSLGVSEADVVVVIVPMMVDGDRNIDFRAIDSATRAIGRGLRPGTLVIYETTLPVGTTRDRFGPILEEQSGLVAGRDFSLAFSPERIRTGRIFRDLATYPKVVGGIDELSSDKAEAFYSSVLDATILRVRDAETAELTKLMETSYRDVNIALANEFAVFAAARGIDMREAAAAANSQPQSHIHEPGVGVGGHCIPVYPYFLFQNANPGELQLARTARQVNDEMASYAVELLRKHLGDLTEKHVAILGVTYRADVKEVAFSSAILIDRALKSAGAIVTMHDPLLSAEEIRNLGGEPAGLDTMDDVDAIILQATHASYRSLPDAFFAQAQIVLDGRGDFDPTDRDLGGTLWLMIGSPPVGEQRIKTMVGGI